MQWRKSDADAIAALMAGLPTALRLDKERRWWPRWLFRSDHVENAAQILNTDKILSRARAEKSQLIIHDSGSDSHIGQLTDQQRDYVRLYFRPRAPTQYANEGIRPRAAIEYEAHMPVPVYLLFSVRLLEYSGVEFTRGRLAIDTPIGESHEFLSSIDFRDVYHDGPVAGYRRPTILNARHAEVIVDGALELDHLKHIVCRSSAERKTLLHLLTDETRLRWSQRMIVDEGRRRLFYKRGTFLQDVVLDRDRLTLQFYANTYREYRGPFDVRAVIETETGKLVGEVSDYIVDAQPLVFRLNPPQEEYVVRITMNGDLAHAAEFDGGEVTDAVLS